MRKLTIKRQKNIAGLFGKDKIYLESPEAELVILGFNCKKLGEIKNGEEKTFEITEEAVRLFVICDALTKDTCVDFKLLPEGKDDVLLTGKNHLDPQNGNPFRFE